MYKAAKFSKQPNIIYFYVNALNGMGFGSNA